MDTYAISYKGIIRGCTGWNDLSDLLDRSKTKLQKNEKQESITAVISEKGGNHQMRRTGKWLAVFLSVTMLAGTAPVYGADISVESDFSSETTDEDVLTDELEGTETTNEPGSGETVSDDQEIIEEPDSDEVEFSADDLADDQEDNTEDVSIEDSDEDLADIAVEDIQDAGESETKEYLKNLSVYSGYGVKDPLEISRREDLDATYGGKTYTVEIGSSYNSTGFM